VNKERRITVYGADWCLLTRRALRHLEELKLEFKYIDVEGDPKASEWVKNHNNGKEKKPTIDIDGKVLTEPTNAELDAALA
jgi:glutaredoxin